MTIRKLEKVDDFLPFLRYLLAGDLHPSVREDAERAAAEPANLLADPSDLLLGAYEQDRLVGLFRVLVIPKDSYVQLLDAFTHSSDAIREVVGFLRERYGGYHLDCVYHPDVSAMQDAFTALGASFYPIMFDMHLDKHIPFEHSHTIIPYRDEYRDEYVAIHDTDVYWTAERVLEATHVFRVFLAVEDGHVVGYLNTTYASDENEIYNVLVPEAHRNRGIAKALVDAAVSELGAKPLTLWVDEDNFPAIRAYRAVGFVQTEGKRSINAYMTL